MNDYDRVAAVLRRLDRRPAEQPSLEELATEAGLRPRRFHELFTRWAGVTPKDFLQCLTAAAARERLRAGESVLATSLDVGLSGPGRLHDLCVTLEAASPGEVKSGGAGWSLVAGFADSPFGTFLLARSPRGICHASFVDSTDREAAEAAIRLDWPHATIAFDDSAASELAVAVFRRPGEAASSAPPLKALVRGTDWQLRVWRALLRVPPGRLVSYGQIADAVCSRAASRAVGAAVGRNPLAWLIPCHRVIRETGVLGDYRWGAERKRAMIGWEGASADAARAASAAIDR